MNYLLNYDRTLGIVAIFAVVAMRLEWTQVLTKSLSDDVKAGLMALEMW